MAEIQATTEHGAEVVIKKVGPGKLTWRDATRGAIMAVLAAVFTTLQQLISNGWDELFTEHSAKTIGLASIGALLIYLIKNFFSETTQVKPHEPEDYAH